MAEMWIPGTIPCRIFNDVHEAVSNPRSGFNGYTGWIRLDASMDGVFGSHYSELIPSPLKGDGGSATLWQIPLSLIGCIYWPNITYCTVRALFTALKFTSWISQYHFP